MVEAQTHSEATPVHPVPGGLVGCSVRTTERDNCQCLVVMYHYIRDQQPITRSELPGLSPPQFSIQVDQLCSELEPITWPTFYAWTRGKASIPRRSFLLTFDDGLAEHGRKVAAILEMHDLRGTFFIPGSVLTTHQMLSAHATHLLLTSLGEDRFRTAIYEELAGDRRCGRIIDSLDIKTAESIYHYEKPTLAHLKYLLNLALPVDIRSQAIQRLFERHIGSSGRWARQWYMSWDDLTALQARGHTIGAHGFSHEPLTGREPLPLHLDLTQSMNVLRDGLGADARPLSYPFGRFDATVTAAARKVGFVQAFTTHSDWVDANSDPFAIARVDTIHVDKTLGHVV